MPFNASISRLSRAVLLGTVFCMLPAMPALAQKTVEGRVDKLEKEMQAVQRKVFPGGSGQIISPDLTPQAAPVQQAGSPASAPIADLTQRVNAIESQVTRLTGQVEENGYKLRQLEEAFAKLQAQQTAATTSIDAAAATGPFTVPAPPPPGRPAATTTPARPAPAAPVKVDGASAQRTQAVAAVERPSTGNAPLDSYTYGFRLWQAIAGYGRQVRQ